MHSPWPPLPGYSMQFLPGGSSMRFIFASFLSLKNVLASSETYHLSSPKEVKRLAVTWAVHKRHRREIDLLLIGELNYTLHFPPRK